MRHTYLPTSWVLLCLGAAPMAFGQDTALESDEEVEAPDDEQSDEPAKPGKAKSEVSEEHTIVSGDTLWDLCAQYLQSPWYWPRVWSYNPEISNPHWIYPGQVVRFYPGGESPGQLDLVSGEMNVPEAPEMEEEVPENLVSVTGTYVTAKHTTSVNVLRNAFVTRQELDGMGFIRASREEVEHLSELNVVYLQLRKAGDVQVGTNLMIYRAEEKIHHPITGKFIGVFTKVLGTCQVVNAAEKAAVAIITSSVEPIVRGDRVAPVQDKLNKVVEPKPNGVELRGYIVGSAITQLKNLGEAHLVFIDKGSDEGVQEGNLFDVIRREDGLFMPGEGRLEGTWDTRMPTEIWGRVMVVDARPNASTGLVIASLRELRVGDRVLMNLK